MTDASPTLPRVHWRLREVMTERGVPSVAALRRHLKDHYPFISDVQLGRVVNHLPERMNMPLLVALCHALECAPSDLMHWGTSALATSRDTPVRTPKAVSAPSPEEIARLRGPAFKVFMLPSEEATS